MKFEHQISEGTYYTQGLRQKGSIVFIVQLNFERKLPRTGIMR